MLIAVLAIMFTASTTEAQEQRLALIITNQAYTATNIPALAAPHRDGERLTEALTKAGFTVEHVRDLSRDRLTMALRAYVRRLRAAGPNAASFFYFSGHGASDGPERGARNYLIPTETAISELSDLAFDGISLDSVIDQLKQSGARTHFVVIDACRDVAFKGTKGGSASFIPTGAQGMLISFATGPNQVARDANIYSSALAEAIEAPGKSFTEVFKYAQSQVARSTSGAQVPHIDDQLTLGSFEFIPKLKPEEIRRQWQALEGSNDLEDLMAFAQQHSGAPESREARRRIANLIAARSDLTDLRTFVKRNPGTDEAQQATKRLRAIDERDWQRANDQGTRAAYDDYLSAHPDGQQAARARKKIAELKTDESRRLEDDKRADRDRREGEDRIERERRALQKRLEELERQVEEAKRIPPPAAPAPSPPYRSTIPPAASGHDRSDILSFIQTKTSYWNQGLVAPDVFAASLRYYGKSVSRSHAANETRKYFERWYQRRFDVDYSSVSISEIDSQTVAVSYSYRFAGVRTGASTRGSGSYDLTLRKTGSSYEIVDMRDNYEAD
jgi:uncharacterized caspase-like protein